MTSKSYTSRRRLRYTYLSYSGDTHALVLNENSEPVSVGVFQIGDDLPPWGTIIRNRGNAVNTYNARFISVKGSVHGRAWAKWDQNVGGQYYPYETSKLGWLGHINAVTIPAASPSTINRAKGAFSKKALARIQPFAGGTFVGELKEAIHMIRNPAQALWNLMFGYLRDAKRLRKVFFKNPKRLTKALSGLWLENVFGWQPLISDVQSGAQALAQLIGKFRPLDFVQVTVPDSTQVDPSTWSGLTGFGNASYSYWTKSVDEVSVRIMGGVDVGPGSSTLGGSLSVLGLDWTSVLPTIWELIPYSFVIDYFTNVGDIISAASIVQSRLTWCGMSQIRKRITTFSGFKDEAKQPSLKNFKSGVDASNLQLVVTDHVRSKIISIVPSFQFKCPGIGSMKWLNLTALAEAARVR